MALPLHPTVNSPIQNFSMESEIMDISDFNASRIDWNQQIGIRIQLIVSPILVIIGTVGNLLSFLVLLRKRMRGTAMYNFLILLAVADTLVLWLSCLKSWIRAVTGFEAMHFSDGSCQFISFIFLTSTYLASWLIVLLTVDRFLAIWFPLGIQSKWSLKQARLAAVGLVILAALANIHVFWTFKIQHSTNRKHCTVNHDYPFMVNGFDYLKLLIYCFVPFVIVLTANILIIYKLRQRTPNQKSPWVNGTTSESIDSDPSHRICYLLLTVSFTWLALMLPYSLIGFIEVFHDTVVLRITCFMLLYTNHSINFFLYCLTGRKFRCELRALFLACFCQPQPPVSRRDSARSSARTEVIMEQFAMKNLKNMDGTESNSSKNSTPKSRGTATVNL